MNVTGLAWELTKKTEDDTPNEYKATGIVERYNTMDEDDIYAHRNSKNHEGHNTGIRLTSAIP